MTATAELLRKHGITLADTKPGRHYTTCPRCSKDRKKHKAAKCLGVTIERDGAHWGCNHCGWTGPEKGSAGAGDHDGNSYFFYRVGDARLRKVKTKSKVIWWEHLVGNEWRKTTGGAPTGALLYRFDETRSAIAEGRTVAVVEGEKDVDNLWRIGIAATCNAHGASEPDQKPKWTGKHSAQLADADLIILNDNDAAGYAHADAVCKLSVGIAKRVRRLDLKDDWPEIPKDGGDVSDWLAVGSEHTSDRLRELIANAPDYEAAPEPPPPIDDDAELERLARLSAWDFERSCLASAKALGVSTGFLKSARKAKRAELGLDGNNGRQGRQYEFPPMEPWPKPVDGAQLLDEIAAAIRRHVIMPPHAAEAIALWVVHTHLFDRFLISPRLALRSVTKQCGKTTTLDILARWVRRALSTVNTSAAALFRITESEQPTLLVDEADTFLKDNEELRGIINSGHRQGGCVLRVEGDQHETRAFATFAPCAIAAIGSLPGTIMDRSLVIDLARRKPDEKIESFRLDRTAALDEIARRIVRWSQDNADAIGARDPDMPPGLYNRNADNWRPLFQIADAAGGGWPERARAAALSGAPDIDEVSRLELLLGDIRDIFDAVPSDLVDAQRISSAELIGKLCEIEPRPWSEFGKKTGKPITQNQLARQLKPLGIAPVLMRISTEVGTEERARGYARHQFAEAFERYLPSEGVSNRDAVTNANTTGTSRTSATVTAEKPVTDGKCEKFNNDGVYHGVTDGKGENGHEGQMGLPYRVIDALGSRYEDDAYRRISGGENEADVRRELDAEARRRLRDEYGVLPEFVEVEFKRVIDAAFRPRVHRR